MQASSANTDRYAKVIEVSKRVRWDIDARRHPRPPLRLRPSTFLPDGLSLVGELPFLSAGDSACFSQVQGRTYANMFGLVERFIGAKMLEVEPRPLRSATRSRWRRWCA